MHKTKTSFAALVAVFVMAAFPSASPQVQSLSLPKSVPIHCSPGNCYAVVNSGTTGFIVARLSAGGMPTDSQGQVWTRDQCTNFTGDCIFSARFNVPYPKGDTITFPAGEGTDAYLLIYDGVWNFDSGSTGDYSISNSAFSDCTNGGDCPYNWAGPLDAVPGGLLIGWSDANSTGRGIASPGFGFNIEASDGLLAVEDMIAPVRSPYFGTLTWLNADGSEGGGSHWLMGFAEYRK